MFHAFTIQKYRRFQRITESLIPIHSNQSSHWNTGHFFSDGETPNKKAWEEFSVTTANRIFQSSYNIINSGSLQASVDINIWSQAWTSNITHRKSWWARRNDEQDTRSDVFISERTEKLLAESMHCINDEKPALESVSSQSQSDNLGWVIGGILQKKKGPNRCVAKLGKAQQFSTHVASASSVVHSPLVNCYNRIVLIGAADSKVPLRKASFFTAHLFLGFWSYKTGSGLYLSATSRGPYS